MKKNLTIDEVIKISLLKECIYIKENFKGNWKVFLDKWNEPFYDLQIAIQYFRDNNEKYKGKYIELSTFEQARKDNGEFDNI